MILPHGEWTTVAQSTGLYRWHYIDGHHGPTLWAMQHSGDYRKMGVWGDKRAPYGFEIACRNLWDYAGSLVV